MTTNEVIALREKLIDDIFGALPYQSSLSATMLTITYLRGFSDQKVPSSIMISYKDSYMTIIMGNAYDERPYSIHLEWGKKFVKKSEWREAPHDEVVSLVKDFLHCVAFA